MQGLNFGRRACCAVGLAALVACGGGGVSNASGSGAELGGTLEQAAFRLAVVGSSTAEGDGASRPESAWVALLVHSLAARADFSVSNLAVGGYTSSDLLPDSGATGNIEDAIGEDPDLILVALAGGNDISSGTSSGTFLSRLARLRDTAQAAGIPTFFVSTAPKDLSDGERQALADWAGRMSQSFESCWVPGSASPYEPCFIDVFDVLANSSLELAQRFDSGDGIHLNDAGHAAVFAVAEPIVESYVCRVTACR